MCVCGCVCVVVSVTVVFSSYYLFMCRVVSVNECDRRARHPHHLSPLLSCRSQSSRLLVNISPLSLAVFTKLRSSSRLHTLQFKVHLYLPWFFLLTRSCIKWMNETHTHTQCNAISRVSRKFTYDENKCTRFNEEGQINCL